MQLQQQMPLCQLVQRQQRAHVLNKLHLRLFVVGFVVAGCCELHEPGAASNAFAAVSPGAAAGVLPAQQGPELARAACLCTGPASPGSCPAEAPSRSQQHTHSRQQQQQLLAAGG